MGGFGAFQLGCRAPDTFDAVVSVAGYGLGTNSKDAPQPYSGALDRTHLPLTGLRDATPSSHPFFGMEVPFKKDIQLFFGTPMTSWKPQL